MSTCQPSHFWRDVTLFHSPIELILTSFPFVPEVSPLCPAFWDNNIDLYSADSIIQVICSSALHL